MYKRQIEILLPILILLSYRKEEPRHTPITVQNTNQENFIAKLGPYAFIESNNIDDYNEKALENIYRILYGIIDNQAYLSIDIAWVRIQFCTNIQTLKWRIVYGSSGTDGWHSFS